MDNSSPSSSSNVLFIAQKALNSARAAEEGVSTINSRRGVASGYAPLDSSGLVPLANLPSSGGGLSQAQVLVRQSFGGF